MARSFDWQPRSGNVTIGGHNVFITQFAGGPLITGNPVGRSALVGDTVSFSVTVAGGPVTYRWFRYGAGPLEDGEGISGATTSNLVLSGVQLSDDGYYRVEVSFPSGVYTSKWTYSKNYRISVGQDRGWLDQVQFVSGAGCVESLSHSSATHSSAPEVGILGVTAGADCSWDAVTLSPWILLLPDPRRGAGFVRYSLEPNDTLGGARWGSCG